MIRPSLARLSGAVVLITAATAWIAQTGCLAGTEFRAAALPAVESGVEQILDGLVDGIFAAIQPETTSG